MSVANSEIDICNLALLDCGAAFITSLAEESVEAKACSLLYPLTRDKVLREHRWNFATKTVAPAIVAGSFGKYTTAFQMPDDCVRVVGMVDSPFLDFKEMGNVIYCNASSIKVEYISNALPVGRYDASFVSALAATLAARLIYKFNQSTNAQAAKEASAKEALRMARTIDGQIGTMQNLERDTFLQARYNGRID